MGPRRNLWVDSVYAKEHWAGSSYAPGLEIEAGERANSRALCSGCARPRPGYDRLAMRRFELVPLWGIKVYLLYARRRAD